jgi:predicted ribosomally synthesized peptide with nif11-like leader
MSDADLKSFVETVANDPELQSAWNDVSSDASRLVALAAQQGYEITDDELKQGLVAIRSAGGELDDSELEHVAGGLSLGAASQVGKKVQFFEAWPCKWNVPDMSKSRRKF